MSLYPTITYKENPTMTESLFLSYEEIRDLNPKLDLDVIQRFGVQLIKGKLSSPGVPAPASCHFLVADGKEGPLTRSAIYVNPACDHPYLKTGFAEVLQRAQEIGNNNTGPFVNKYFRMPNADATKPRGAWCAGFASWVLLQTHGKELDAIVGATPFGAYELGQNWGGMARSPAATSDDAVKLDARGSRVSDVKALRMGDLAIWKHPERFNGHVGLTYGLTRIPGSDYIYMVVLEGNGDAYRGQVRVYAYAVELGCHSGSLRFRYLARR